jgi:hypothetical protein
LCAGAAQAEATQATPAGTPAPRDQNDGPAPGEEVDEVVVTAKRAPPPLPADIQIEQALFKLLETDPQRVVCTRRAPTGTRVPRVTCGSVERWFGARTPEDVADERAPWQLVEQIKFNRRMRAKNQRPG